MQLIVVHRAAILTLKEMNDHVMLSSRAVINGGNKECIWGYLLNDIKTEITRGSRVTCIYLNKKGAIL